MQQLQLFFDRTLKTQQEMKELKLMLKDALANSQEHKIIIEDMKALRERRKKIENVIKEDFSGEVNKLDTLKLDLENDKLLMSDSALNQLVNGEQVIVKDKNGIEFEPIFSVKFKKIK